MTEVQLIGISPTQLVDLIDQRHKKQIEELKKHFQPKEPSRYLRRKEVAEMLSVDVSSIHNYTVKGILTAHQISGRILYKLDEVEKAIIKLKR